VKPAGPALLQADESRAQVTCRFIQSADRKNFPVFGPTATNPLPYSLETIRNLFDMIS